MEVAKNMRNRTLMAIAALTLTFGWASNAQAQAQPTNDQANPLTDFQNPNGSADPFNNRGGDANSSMLQLMQRLMQQGSTSPTEFRAAQQENLTDAAALFRAKQQARLKQLQGAPAAPAPAPIAPAAMPLAPLTP
jgi:dsDNA-binding SOS-regulon protein